MAATPKELEHQTMTSVGKVSVTDDNTAILLGLMGFSATKLWNAAVWYTKKMWETTGKIPAYADLDVAMKQEHPLWYRRLHSQSAQAVLEDLWQSHPRPSGRGGCQVLMRKSAYISVRTRTKGNY